MTSTLLGFLLLASPPPSADQVITRAASEAAKQHKNVLVYFHASWCSWCRRTDGLFASPEFGKKFSDSYVIAQITIRERDEKRAMENPGWEETLLKIRGTKDKDVPYFAVLDSKRKKLGDGYRYAEGTIPGNGGYPKTGPEADAFVDLIRQTGKAFTEQDLSKLKAYFLLQ